MKPLEVGTSQRAENLKKKSSKILRSKNGIGGAPTNYRRRRRRRRADQQKSAAAALTNWRRRRRGAAGAQLYPVGLLHATYLRMSISLWSPESGRLLGFYKERQIVTKLRVRFSLANNSLFLIT